MTKVFAPKKNLPKVRKPVSKPKKPALKPKGGLKLTKGQKKPIAKKPIAKKPLPKKGKKVVEKPKRVRKPKQPKIADLATQTITDEDLTVLD